LAEVGVVVDPVPHKLHVPGQVALADQGRDVRSELQLPTVRGVDRRRDW
jgi:hypothetical protein